VVLARREQLVLLWPLEKILCMTVLKYAAQVRSPVGYSEELTDCEAAEEERALAATLVDQTTRPGGAELEPHARPSLARLRSPLLGISGRVEGSNKWCGHGRRNNRRACSAVDFFLPGRADVLQSTVRSR